MTIRVAIVGYRDIQDKGRFMEFEFTKDIEALKNFIQTFVATSMERNSDRPEDVAGGLKLSLMQEWTE